MGVLWFGLSFLILRWVDFLEQLFIAGVELREEPQVETHEQPEKAGVDEQAQAEKDDEKAEEDENVG